MESTQEKIKRLIRSDNYEDLGIALAADNGYCDLDILKDILYKYFILEYFKEDPKLQRSWSLNFELKGTIDVTVYNEYYYFDMVINKGASSYLFKFTEVDWTTQRGHVDDLEFVMYNSIDRNSTPLNRVLSSKIL